MLGPGEIYGQISHQSPIPLSAAIQSRSHQVQLGFDL
jgi:hypothetical protein